MKSIVLALLALTLTTIAAPKPPLGIPADAKFYEGRWFKVYYEKVPWNRAKEKCAAAGGRLACIPDPETWSFVKEMIAQASVWLGATDESAPGVWKWLDGAPVAYGDWFTNQPDNARGVEHYLATYKAKWNDAPKDGGFLPNQFVSGYVCEWRR